MYEFMIASTMLVDAGGIFVLGMQLLGHGQEKTVGAAFFVGGAMHFVIGLILMLVVGEPYDGLLVWVFALTFLFAGYVEFNGLDSIVLANYVAVLGTIVLAYTIDYARHGYLLWTMILVVFVILYAMFTAMLYERLNPRIVGYYSIFAAIVCLIPGVIYSWGYTFM